ncbi:hypothetical protein AUJ78_00310 [Candidatus Peregrinibacteria bacterium CG1_02_41_10]|nr:MAG: hypothetical protein AUJ78_00310 [Candidatus Peregrinibacteria bacterium CG1_02_41_10]
MSKSFPTNKISLGIKEHAYIFKSLYSPIRQAILLEMKIAPVTETSCVKKFKLHPSTISQHFRNMVQSGVIREIRREKNNAIYYGVNEKVINKAYEYLRNFTQDKI